MILAPYKATQSAPSGSFAAVLIASTILAASGQATAQQNDPPITTTSPLRVAIQVFNPLVSRNADGHYSGVAVDVANDLGKKYGKPVKLVFYPDLIKYNQSITKDEWDMAITPRDLSRAGQLGFSEPFMEIDHSYVVRPGVQINTPEDVDRPNVRIGVAQASSADSFLTRTIRNARILRVYGAGMDAKQALNNQRIDVYADYTHRAYRIALEVPGANVLVSRFNVMRMTIALPKSNSRDLSGLNDFIKETKRDGVITEAINRAGLRGARAAR